jgi:hypothetical protein
MSNPANWFGGQVPVAGDHLIFSDSASSGTVNNDLANANFSGISLVGRAAYTLNGNEITFTPASSTPLFDLGNISQAPYLDIHAPVHLVAGTYDVRGYADLRIWNGMRTEPSVTITLEGLAGIQMRSGLSAEGPLTITSTGPTNGGHLLLIGTGSSFPAGLDLIGAFLGLSQDTFPAGARLNIGPGAAASIGDAVVSTGDFSCSGRLFLFAGTGAVRVFGHGTLNDCSIQPGIVPNIPPPTNGQYTLIQDAGPAPFTVTSPDPAEGAPLQGSSLGMVYTYRGGTSGHDVALTIPPPSVQDMWWSGPVSENGWGMSIVQHYSELFAVLYVYDDAGKPTWYVLPNGQWDSQFKTYSGSLYVPQGSPYYAYDTTRFIAGPSAGDMSVTFPDDQHAALTVHSGGKTVTKNLVRQVFDSSAPYTAGLGDLWWGGTAQNGWGISVIQHHSILFIVWYTYDDAGVPRWYVMPGGTWTTGLTYEGDIFRTTGTPWFNGPYNEQDLKVFDVGRYKFSIVGPNATLDYTIDTHTGTLQLQHEPF